MVKIVNYFKINFIELTGVHRFSIVQDNCIYGSFLGNDFYGGFFEVNSVNGSFTVLGPLDAERWKSFFLNILL